MQYPVFFALLIMEMANAVICVNALIDYSGMGRGVRLLINSLIDAVVNTQNRTMHNITTHKGSLMQ